MPSSAQKPALEACQRWQHDSSYPGLHFKPIDPSDPSVYSIRIGMHYRAICERQPDGTYLWVWIGTHEEHNNLI
ncbi:MAG: ParE family toxin-like protein [Ktedonobacterales bacterium]